MALLWLRMFWKQLLFIGANWGRGPGVSAGAVPGQGLGEVRRGLLGRVFSHS